MELIHKLKVGKVTETTITKQVEGSVYTFQPKYSGEAALIIGAHGYTQGGSWVTNSYSLTYEANLTTVEKEHSRNCSRALTLVAGDYVVHTKISGGSFVLFKCSTYYSPTQKVTYVGTYTDGSTITIATEGDYLLAQAEGDLTGTSNLSHSLAILVDKQEVVKNITYTEYTIDEPIGFDNLKMTMKRHDYHGMGAEVSLDNLEFYGQAFSIIKQAYEADIDSEIMYTVLADSKEIYSGKIDLSTYSVKQGDYQSVSVKVGEIGVKTTFNNRLETEVDLNKCETIDGTTFDRPNWLKLHIPPKHLLYTNYAKQKADETITTSGGYNPRPDIGIYIGTSAPYIFLPIGTNVAEEFGSTGQSVSYSTDDITKVAPQYIASEDHETNFGATTKVNINIHLNATIVRVQNGWSPTTGDYIKWRLVAVDKDENFIYGEQKQVKKSVVNYKGTSWDLSCNLQGELNAGGSIKYYLLFDIDLGTATAQNFYASIIVHKGSYVKMTMYDNLTEDAPVYADMLLTHDALNVVAQAISETALTVKSDWYRTPESKWNSGSLGGGALKALTNGYKIRGLFADEDNERNMPLSFKDLIKSLNAQDCIGWGFSTEDGETCVRVERWDWFYKSYVILTLTDVAEVQTDIDPDRIITELTIGYKKYATNDQYNSIDSPHGKATYANAIKAVSNAETQECEFVADNYAIEETRRAASGDETKETSYDEVLFLFELVKSTAGVYSIGHTAYNGTNIGYNKEFINAKLTPRHMASRWRDFIFATNNSTSFKYTTGELNNHAAFIVLPTYLNAQYSLQPFEGSSFKMEESDSLAYTHAAFQAEKITFSYPLTIAQYKTVKANPYGLVSVNGKQGWITDFKYSFADGMADFTLIAKHN